LRIAAGWSEYHQKERVDKDDPIYAIVVSELPAELRRHLTDYDNIFAEGSTGAGT